MSWRIAYLKEAAEDLASFDGAVRRRIFNAIEKVAENPLPQSEGGYGKPLGNLGGQDLTGLLKVKLRADGVRIVYKFERTDEGMLIVVIGMRAENDVYRIAASRRQKHDL